MTYQTKVYNEIGGDKLVIASGGEIRIESGGKITNAGTQAAAIADATAITGGESPTEAEHNTVITKVNAILAAMRGAGVIAT